MTSCVRYNRGVIILEEALPSYKLEITLCYYGIKRIILKQE